MTYKFERQGYKFKGLEGADPYLLPYIKDSLQWNYNLQWDIFENIKSAYGQFIAPIVEYLKQKKGTLKEEDKDLEYILKLTQEQLAKNLQLIIYNSLKEAAFIAGSVTARLKLDELISFNLDELDELKDEGQDELIDELKATSEIIKASTPKGEETQEKRIKYKLKLVQSFELKHAEQVAKNTFDKARVFDNKEFKLSSRIWDLTEKNLSDIKTILRENQNVDCAKIAKMLEKYQRTDYATTCSQYPSMMARLNGRVPGTLFFEAFRLARNENAEVAFKQSIEKYQENSFIEAVKWLLSNNRNPKYERLCKCNDVAYEDRYGLGEGIYPKDAVPNRPHVMCLCNIAPITGRQFKKALKEGLKLGNVPADWWLEEKKLLDEIRRNSPEEKQYKLQFNSTLSNKNRAQILGITKENTPLIFQKDIKDDVGKINKLYFELLNKCKDKPTINLNYKGIPHYNPNTNTINTNLFNKDPRSLQAGFKTNMTGLLHEGGHYLDYNLMNKKGVFLHNKIPHLKQTLEQDALKLINRTYRQVLGKNAYDFRSLAPNELKNGLQFYEKLGKMKGQDFTRIVANELAKQPHINSAVSDILEGLTNGQLAGYSLETYGHMRPNNLNYWDSLFAIESEVIAHMFEALGSSGVRLQAMHEHFPTSWDMFLKYIKRF